MKLARIIVISTMMIVLAASAYAQSCSDLSLTANPNSFVVNGSTNKINFDISSPGGPLNIWLDYAHVNLSLPGSMSTADATVVNLSTSTSLPEQWSITTSNAGVESVNATVFNSTGFACTIGVNVTSVVAADDPSLSLIVSQPANGSVGINQNITITFNNTGSGDAVNVAAYLSGNGINVSNPDVTASNVSAGGSSVITREIAGHSCATTNLNLDVLSYFDNDGDLQSSNPSASHTVSFTGSDLTTDANSIVYSNTAPTEGDTITINFTVENVGEENSSSGEVLLYYNDNVNNVIGTVAVGSLGVNQTFNATLDWTSLPSGTHTVHAQYTGTVECASGHTQSFPSLTVSSAAVAAAANNNGGGSSGGGSSGGGSSGFSTPTLTPDENDIISFRLRIGQSIRFFLEEESHTFSLLTIDQGLSHIRIESDPVEVKLREGQQRTLDITGDQVGDIRLTSVDHEGAFANFTIAIIDKTPVSVNDEQEEVPNVPDLPEATIGDSDNLLTGSAVGILAPKNIIAGLLVLLILGAAGWGIYYVLKKLN